MAFWTISNTYLVIPAKAGIQFFHQIFWIPCPAPLARNDGAEIKSMFTDKISGRLSITVIGTLPAYVFGGFICQYWG